MTSGPPQPKQCIENEKIFVLRYFPTTHRADPLTALLLSIEPNTLRDHRLAGGATNVKGNFEADDGDTLAAGAAAERTTLVEAVL